MNKAELIATIDRYAVVNDQKNELANEVKDLGAEIKDYFADNEIAEFTTAHFITKVAVRKSKKLDIAKVSKLLGYPIPADCYEETESEVLTVKPLKADAIAMPKVA